MEATKSKKKMSESTYILDLLADAGPNGMAFTDIQRELWKMSHSEPFTREARGYWCDPLLGSLHTHQGLLHLFAFKGPDGRWRRNKIDHKDHPWSTMSGH
jgi:hypothetical protein